jgi:hypothetical protein
MNEHTFKTIVITGVVGLLMFVAGIAVEDKLVQMRIDEANPPTTMQSDFALWRVGYVTGYTSAKTHALYSFKQDSAYFINTRYGKNKK